MKKTTDNDIEQLIKSVVETNTRRGDDLDTILRDLIHYYSDLNSKRITRIFREVTKGGEK